MEQIFVAFASEPSLEAIRAAIRRGLEALGISLPTGRRIFLQPACPWAHPRFAPHAFTPVALLEALRSLFIDCSIIVGAGSLPGFPARYAMQQAGYGDWARRHRIPLIPLDEVFDGQASRWPDLLRGIDLWIALPRLTGSGFLGFAGAARHHMFLLNPTEHLHAYPRLPEVILQTLQEHPPHLIILDATQVLHRGGSWQASPLRSRSW